MLVILARQSQFSMVLIFLWVALSHQIFSGLVVFKGLNNCTGNFANNEGTVALSGSATLSVDGQLLFLENSATSYTALYSTASGKVELTGTLNAISNSLLVSTISVLSFRQVAGFSFGADASVLMECPPGYNPTLKQSLSSVIFSGEYSAQILVSSLDVGCVACPQFQYSMGRGVVVLRHESNFTEFESRSDWSLCQDCPSEGASCFGGAGFFVNPNFWATLSRLGTWSPTLCPVNYCCLQKYCLDNEPGFCGCEPRAPDSCAAGRDPDIPLWCPIFICFSFD